jgi:UDP-galactopyranose mutase
MNIVIIGGGFAGCASAELLSNYKDFKITLIERNSFLGAGVRTFFFGGHPYTYGPRHFLTQKKETYEYLKKFLDLRSCNYHQFKSYVETDNKFYNYPLNMADINMMEDKQKIFGELKKLKKNINPKNLEEFWIKSIGKILFNKIIDKYNKKMWLVDSCSKIDTFKWSPKGYTIKTGKRAAFDNYISAYPSEKDGYNSFFDNLLKRKNIKFHFNTSVISVDTSRKKLTTNKKLYINFDVLINTISPDEIFNKRFGELGFIGRDLHKIVFPTENVFPKNVFFLYYPNDEKFTRLVEYKKFTQHKSKTSLIGMEVPSMNGKYYPLPFKSEQKKAKKYFSLMPKNFYSIGRAGTYRYEVDIDDCIWQALQIKKQIENGKWDGPVIGDEFKS